MDRSHRVRPGPTFRPIASRRHLLVVGGVLVPQGPQPAGQVRELEGVPAQHVDVVPHKRREAGDVLVPDVEAVGAELGDGGVHVPGVEEDQGVGHESEGADLV